MGVKLTAGRVLDDACPGHSPEDVADAPAIALVLLLGLRSLPAKPWSPMHEGDMGLREATKDTQPQIVM